MKLIEENKDRNPDEELEKELHDMKGKSDSTKLFA